MLTLHRRILHHGWCKHRRCWQLRGCPRVLRLLLLVLWRLHLLGAKVLLLRLRLRLRVALQSRHTTQHQQRAQHRQLARQGVGMSTTSQGSRHNVRVHLLLPLLWC